MNRHEKMKKRFKGISLVIMAAFLWGLGGFLSKIAVDSIGPWKSAFIRTIVFFPIVIGYVLSRKGFTLKLEKDIIYSIGAGLTVGIGIILVRLSLTYYDVSIVKPIQRLSILVTVILSVYILDEKITLTKGIGVILALLAFFFLFPLNSNLLDLEIGHLYLILLILSLGMTTIFLRLGILKNGLNNARFYRAAGQTLIVVFAVILVTGTSQLSLSMNSNLFYPALNGILGAGAFILFCSGLETVDASTAKPMIILATITSVILGIVILGESFTVEKLVGVLLAVVAVALLSYDRS